MLVCVFVYGIGCEGVCVCAQKQHDIVQRLLLHDVIHFFHIVGMSID